MKASLAMVVASATLALAGPLNKRKYVTDWDVVTVTEYIYPNGSPAPTPTTSTQARKRPTSASAVTTSTTSTSVHVEEVATTIVSTTSAVVVVPTPTTTSSPKPSVFVTTVVEAPKPTTTSTSSSQAAVEIVVSTQVLGNVASSIVAAVTSESAAPAATSSASTSSTGNSVTDKTLSSHNVHRQNHSASALTWDDTLAGYALTAAMTCVFEHDLSPGGGGYGQNIAMYGSSTSMPDAGTAIEQAVTNMWYNGEIELYPGYGTEPSMTNFDEWGHFSQVVWAGSEKVGCASYKCAAGTMSTMESWFTVCNYSPAGNYGGEYAANVKAPSGMASITVTV